MVASCSIYILYMPHVSPQLHLFKCLLSVSHISSTRIQECLESIQSLLKDLPLPENVSASRLDLEEHLNCVSNYHCIEKTACYDVDIEELQNFFVKLVRWFEILYRSFSRMLSFFSRNWFLIIYAITCGTNLIFLRDEDSFTIANWFISMKSTPTNNYQIENVIHY